MLKFFRILYCGWISRAAPIACLAFSLLFLLYAETLVARDINLDTIYIRKSSKYLSRLLLDKLDAYQNVDALFIDRDVIFAGWITGYEILYVREVKDLNQNIVFLHHIESRKTREICRIPGVITAAKISNSGKIAVLKRLIQGNGIIPRGDTVICMIPGGKVKNFAASNAFLDFNIPAEGESVVYETGRGFVEYFPDSGRETLVLARSRYSAINDPNNPSIAFFSPDRGSVLVINGGGGSYNARVLTGARTQQVNGITSAGEVVWLSSSSLAFRSGYTGNFAVTRHDIFKNSYTHLISGSMNTGLSLSLNAKTLAFLKDQLVHVYALPNGKLINTGIEGEDISFSPVGNRFTSLMFKKLFVVNLHTVLKKQIELKRCWEKILFDYRELLKNRDELENEYSLDYVNRKISLYSSMVKKP